MRHKTFTMTECNAVFLDDQPCQLNGMCFHTDTDGGPGRYDVTLKTQGFPKVISTDLFTRTIHVLSFANQMTFLINKNSKKSENVCLLSLCNLDKDGRASMSQK
jgi:hypothetical protein